MITKEAKNTDLNVKNRYFTKSARNAFLHVLRYIKSKNDKPILLPAYIGINDYEGSGVFDSVFISRIPYAFYPLDHKLNVDFDVLKAKIASEEYSALMLIHYFGFPTQQFEEIVALCQKHHVLLIEDCAHVINGEFKGKKLGEFGDFSFYSIHKSIAAMDGGMLKINNPSLADFPAICPLKEGISVSTLTQLLRSDLDEIDEKRRNNYNYLLQGLAKSSHFSVMQPELPAGIAPLNFPVLIHNAQREKIYFDLLKEGVLTMALYYRMIPQLNRAVFPLAYEVSEQILNFPIHQEIEKADLDKMITVFNSLINKLN